MNFEIPEFYETLERQLGCDFSDFYIFSNSQESHIHDQRYRIAEFYLPETKLSEERFSQRYELLKALYLATFEATKKWTMPIRN